MISLIKNDRIEMITMLQEDDPQIFHAIITNEIKQDSFISLPLHQQEALTGLQDVYKRMLELKMMQQEQAMARQMEMAAAIQGASRGQTQ